MNGEICVPDLLMKADCSDGVNLITCIHESAGALFSIFTHRLCSP